MTTNAALTAPAGGTGSPVATVLRGAALTAVAVVGVICASAWPTVAVALALLIVTVALAWRAPSLAFLVALLVSATVGVLKARLGAEQAPSPDTFGAAYIDILLLISFVGLMFSDRGRSLRALWHAGGRSEQVVWTLLFAWLVISVLQIPESGHLTQAVKGFRLTQAYVPLVLAGIVVFPLATDREQLTDCLLAVFAVIAGYAALRAVIGPAAWERVYALSQSQQAQLAGLFRDIGSFNSPQDMVSYLAPAGVFALIVGLLDARVRTFAWLTFLLAAAAVVESYVRIGLVAGGVGVGVVGVLVLLSKTVSRRARIVAVLVTLLVAGAGYSAAIVAGAASPVTAERAGGLNHPLSDASIQDRWTRWKHAARTALDHPLGTGIGTVGSATGSASTFARRGTGRYTDNSYLKVLDEQGIPIGLLFIIGIIGTVFLLGRRLTRAGPLGDPVAAAGLGGFVAFLTLCILGEYVEWPGKVVAWTLLGIALAHGYGLVDRSRASNVSVSR